MSATIDPITHRIDGSRTTVYHVLDYLQMNWPAEKIVQYLPISVEQVLAAEKFIHDHRDEVMGEYQKMLERDEKGNSPEVEAKLVDTRRKMREVLEERRACAQSSR